MLRYIDACRQASKSEIYEVSPKTDIIKKNRMKTNTASYDPTS